MPAGVMTTTSTVDGLPAGAVAVSCVPALFRLRTATTVAPNRTPVASPRLAPLIVTTMPPPRGPEAGEMLVTTGAGAAT